MLKLRYLVRSPEHFISLRAAIEQGIQTICNGRAFAPVLAVNEAVNNALIHGKGVHDGDVSITIRLLGGQRLLIRVEDPGQGFSTDAALHSVENIWEERGRGRFLIETMMDKVIYNRAGNGVLMVKKLER